MDVSKPVLRRYLSNVSFAEDGDHFERTASAPVVRRFPNCEEFWKYFVVPLTRRMSAFPTKVGSDKNFRDSVAEVVQDIASMHYSMFLNLVFAHRHIETHHPSSLEDAYVHLAAACDLAEGVLVKWFILLRECRGLDIELLQRLSKQQFTDLAAQWYDRHYSHLYEKYAERGKPPPIWLPTRVDVLGEYLAGHREHLKQYKRASQPIREYRNVIVHDLRIGRIVLRGESTFVPKSSLIQNYRTWRSVFSAANDPEKVSTDFREVRDQCRDDLQKLATALNDLWSILVSDFQNEFYAEEREALVKLFDLRFREGPHLPSQAGGEPSSSDHFQSASGTYSSGSSSVD